jgi:hypothetical protein
MKQPAPNLIPPDVVFVVLDWRLLHRALLCIVFVLSSSQLSVVRDGIIGT